MMRKHTWLILCVVVLGGVCLRWWGLGEKSLWFDEGYTAWITALSAGDAISAIRYDYSPPGYFLSAWFWAKVFGDSEFALRSLSALAGSISIVLVALLTWRMTGKAWTTILAVVLIDVSQLQVVWSQTARTYATASTLFILAAYLIVLHRQSGKLIWLILASLSAAALLYQHNVMWFYMVSLNLILFFWPSSEEIRKTFLRAMVFNGLALVLFAPWIPGFIQQVTQQRAAYFTEPPVFYDVTRAMATQAGVAPDDFRRVLVSMLGEHDSGSRLYRLGIFGGAVFLIVMALGVRKDSERRQVLILVLAALAPMALAFVYSHVRKSVWIDKAFIPTSTILPIIFASALGAGGARLLRAGAGVAFAVISIGGLITSLDYLLGPAIQDWRAATLSSSAIAAKHQRPCAIFVANECEMVYHYYLRRLNLPEYPSIGAPHDFFADIHHATMARVTKPEDLDGTWRFVEKEQADVLFYFEQYTGWADPNGHTRAWLDGRWRIESRKAYGELILHTYHPRGAGDFVAQQ